MMPFRLSVAQPLAVFTAAAVPTTLWIADGVLMRRKLQAERLKLQAARRDPVTGLHGRDGYTHRATDLVRRYGDHSLVVFLDMAGFKKVNDTFGHDAGNEVLAATGQRLEQWAGKHGVAARLYGDEFAAAARIPAQRRPIRLAQLHHLVHQPVRVGDRHVDVAVSIGAASPSDLNTKELARLLRAADGAMYEHKQERHGDFRIATTAHMNGPMVNGRSLGRSGTGTSTAPSAVAA
ncbi:GGDEF domain-containing protein [Streptomyces sp. Edi4]|uniref:GGDEF domain-containing protein n=1 Tax=Streptomyces sp. Edi4 TaxID=3162527 RepID=UPI0033068295